MTDNADKQPEREHERRAPLWRVRCLKCGLEEPWGKYGIRLAAAGRHYTLGWCSRCRWIRCHVVQRNGSE